tara:strand:+ start:41 stop:580 length:540 start_codon:yes stop_codon:yes gene_type:complete
MNKKEIKQYAKEHKCSIREAQRQLGGVATGNVSIMESSVKSIKDVECRLLIKKTDTRDGSVELAYADVEIPSKPSGNRDKMLGEMGQEWNGYIDNAMITATLYLSHSPYLTMANSLVNPEHIVNNHGIVSADINNLACFLHFEIDDRGVGTQGPQWMSIDEIEKLSKKLQKEYPYTEVA